MREPEYADIANEPHVLRVLSYDPLKGNYICRWGEHPHQKIEIHLRHSFPSGEGPTDPKSIVGYLIELDYSYPETWTAGEARVLRTRGVGPI